MFPRKPSVQPDDAKLAGADTEGDYEEVFFMAEEAFALESQVAGMASAEADHGAADGKPASDVQVGLGVHTKTRSHMCPNLPF